MCQVFRGCSPIIAMSDKRKIITQHQFNLINERLTYQLIENHDFMNESVIIGLQPRGSLLANCIVRNLKKIYPSANINAGSLDITFFRDDFRRNDEFLAPKTTDVNFLVENKKVIIIDDVLYTGRTVRAGIEAVFSFGRPKKIELLIFIDRRYNREIPLKPDYTGLEIDTINSEKVKLNWNNKLTSAEVFIHS